MCGLVRWALLPLLLLLPPSTVRWLVGVGSSSGRKKRSLRKRRKRSRFFDDVDVNHCVDDDDDDDDENDQLISSDRKERIGLDLRWTTSDEDGSDTYSGNETDSASRQADRQAASQPAN